MSFQRSCSIEKSEREENDKTSVDYKKTFQLFWKFGITRHFDIKAMKLKKSEDLVSNASRNNQKFDRVRSENDLLQLVTSPAEAAFRSNGKNHLSKEQQLSRFYSSSLPESKSMPDLRFSAAENENFCSKSPGSSVEYFTNNSTSNNAHFNPPGTVQLVPETTESKPAFSSEIYPADLGMVNFYSMNQYGVYYPGDIIDDGDEFCSDEYYFTDNGMLPSFTGITSQEIKKLRCAKLLDFLNEKRAPLDRINKMLEIADRIGDEIETTKIRFFGNEDNDFPCGGGENARRSPSDNDSWLSGYDDIGDDEFTTNDDNDNAKDCDTDKDYDSENECTLILNCDGDKDDYAEDRDDVECVTIPNYDTDKDNNCDGKEVVVLLNRRRVIETNDNNGDEKAITNYEKTDTEDSNDASLMSGLESFPTTTTTTTTTNDSSAAIKKQAANFTNLDPSAPFAFSNGSALKTKDDPTEFDRCDKASLEASDEGGFQSKPDEETTMTFRGFPRKLYFDNDDDSYHPRFKITEQNGLRLKLTRVYPRVIEKDGLRMKILVSA